MRNPFVSSIHLFVEDDFTTSKLVEVDWPYGDKLTILIESNQLTFQRAFNYANHVNILGHHFCLMKSC